MVQEADGVLTATIGLLTPLQQVNVGPIISDPPNNSATAMILDDDLVVRVATTVANQTSITISENVGNVTLRLMLFDHADQPLTINRALQVSLNYADDSGLLGTSPSFVVNVPVDAIESELQFTVPINDDLIVAQPDRNIDVSVVTGAGYTAPLDVVSIIVTDNDMALVSIMPVNSTIVQSESAEFEVMLLSQAPAQPRETATAIDIRIDVEFGQGQGNTSTTVTIPEGQTRALLTVPTVDNTVSSTVVATLEGTSHSALTIGDPRSATIVILDNLVVGIQILNESGFTAASTVVSEAVGDIILQLDFTPAVSRPLEVELTYTGAIGFLSSAVSSLQISASTSTMTTLRVTITNDLIALQPDRNINIAVFDGQDYTVSSTSSAVNLTITDDDDVGISVSPSPSEIEEGDDAGFELTLSKETAIDVSARVSFTASGSVFFIPPMDRIVTFTAGETTKLLITATVEDATVESDGLLSLNIDGVSDSRLALINQMSSVRILDNDVVVSVIWGNRESETTASESAGTENLFFTISDEVNRPLNLQLLYSGDPGALTGEFSADNTANRIVDVVIPANVTFIEFPVVIIDDNIAGESFRTVTISIIDAFGYELGGISANLIVVDDDIARVSISPTTDTVTEGTIITFTVTQDLDSNIETRFDIGLSPTDGFLNSSPLSTTGDDFRNSLPDSSFFVSNTSNTLTVAFPSGTVTKTFTYDVDTVNDNMAESDGLLVSTLRPTGLLETDSSISSITILDDDSKVGITALDGASTVSEGAGSVTLQLNIDPPTDHALNVNLLYTGDLKALLGVLRPPTDSSGTTITEMSTIVTVPAGNSTHLFDITIRDDAFAEFEDEVQVIVQAGDNYQVTDVANSTEVATIIEDDDVAQVSINPVNNPVTEGELIELIITRDLITEEETVITLVLTPTGLGLCGFVWHHDDGDKLSRQRAR